jgi:hypothetical protein
VQGDTKTESWIRSRAAFTCSKVTMVDVSKYVTIGKDCRLRISTKAVWIGFPVGRRMGSADGPLAISV